MNTQKSLILLGSVFMVSILFAGVSMNAQAEMYDDYNQYAYDNNYNNYYEESKNTQVEVQKISCINYNTNINGIDITEVPEDGTALAAANEGAGPDTANAQNGNGITDKINFNKNLVNICVNLNVNDQLKTPAGGGDHPEG